MSCSMYVHVCMYVCVATCTYNIYITYIHTYMCTMVSKKSHLYHVPPHIHTHVCVHVYRIHTALQFFNIYTVCTIRTCTYLQYSRSSTTYYRYTTGTRIIPHTRVYYMYVLKLYHVPHTPGHT